MKHLLPGKRKAPSLSLQRGGLNKLLGADGSSLFVDLRCFLVHSRDVCSMWSSLNCLKLYIETLLARFST